MARDLKPFVYLLDTDIASYIIKAVSPAVDDRLRSLTPSQVCISAVTRSELRFGIHRLPLSHRLAVEVERFLSGIRTLPWDQEAADRCGEIRAQLHLAGTPIGVADTMIAAHAIAVDAILVTNNVKHFRQIKNLRMENWTN